MPTSASATAPALATQMLGVDSVYRDSTGVTRSSSPETVAMISELLRHGDDAARTTAIVARRGDALPHDVQEILLETGASLGPSETIARNMPFGYHTLVLDGGATRSLIVSPGRCTTPAADARFGLAVQLYAARSRASWGMGDLGDLRTVANWASLQGASFALLNPLHAPLMTPAQEASPYFASSRIFKNPLFLRIDEVPGYAEVARDRDWQARATRINAEPHIDRDAIWALKREVLEAIFTDTPRTDEFAQYEKSGGDLLRDYARFCAITEVHGAPWRQWPETLRTPRSAAVTEFANKHAPRVQFHAWLQWLIESQLDAAQPSGFSLMHDLAVGVNPDGADCWMHGDVFVDGFTVGAPPDTFNTLGQNWAQPPFHPRRLAEVAYAPFVEMLRTTCARGNAVRIDHIMGLFRLWWIPPGGKPSDGAYVRYPSRELLDILALESRRAGTIVVGEDLGTVERGVRPTLRRRNVLSYRLLAFGSSLPVARFPKNSMAAVTTHDLPTIAGLWSGSDVAAQRERDLHPNEAGTAATRHHVGIAAGVEDNASVDEVIVKAHAALTHAPSLLVSASLEDLAAATLRPNMPGTVPPTWPNWSIPLPRPVEDVLASPLAQNVVAALRRNR